MPDIQKKIKAVRRLRGLSQSKVAELAHLHVKTYQRIESATSSVTHDLLESLASIFDCTAEEISHFDLKTNQFDALPPTSSEEEQLQIENAFLKAENGYLRGLLGKFMDNIPDLPNGGGQN